MKLLRIFLAILIILSISCNKEEVPTEICCSNEDCSILNPFSFSSFPSKGGINVSYGIRLIVDGIGKTCYPEKIIFYISDNELDYQKVAEVEPIEGTLFIDNLEDCKEYSVKMVNFHSEVDSIVSIQKILAGEIPQPKFINSPSWITNTYFEDFRLSPLGNQLIVRNNSNDWFIASFDDSNIGNKIAENAFYAQWNPNKATEISVVENIKLESVSAITSKRLVAVDINSASRTILHEITHPWDFNYDSLNSKIYWIHNFHYSLNGDAIYFASNKDNGATNLQEKSIYNNIWKLDLQTKEIEPLLDLLSLEIDLHAFIEDPKQNGNFYLYGYSFAIGKTSIYYYDTQDKTLSLIHPIQGRPLRRNISIDPLGKNILYTSDRTGQNEIWSYNLTTNQLKQITNSNTYYPLNRWFHINWISDNEFLTLLEHDNQRKFAVFSIR